MKIATLITLAALVFAHHAVAAPVDAEIGPLDAVIGRMAENCQASIRTPFYGYCMEIDRAAIRANQALEAGESTQVAEQIMIQAYTGQIARLQPLCALSQDLQSYACVILDVARQGLEGSSRPLVQAK